jgi:capsular exopolysaccharide synthesis family protein
MPNIGKGLAKARAARAAALRAVEAAAPAVAADDSADDGLDLARLERVKLELRVLAENRVVIDDESPASAAYKMLRTRVLQRMRRNGWKTIAVTSTCPGEGKSLTALNLSINLARDVGTSVVLVDLDLRKPSIHRHLGIRTQYGIGDYLRGTTTLEQTAFCPGLARLGVIANDRSYPNSSELLTSPQIADLVRRVKQGEDRIAVFDLPPLLVSDDMLAFSPLVDAVLIVLAQGKTRRPDMVDVRDLLENVNVVGAVLNRSSAQVAPYYYGSSPR